ncbi:MAG: response regulator, partial [Bacteroidota bacterium]
HIFIGYQHTGRYAFNQLLQITPVRDYKKLHLASFFCNIIKEINVFNTMELVPHKQLTVILIDEDVDDHHIFSEALHDASSVADVCVLPHEKELYSYFESGEVPHLFFLDWKMPCMFERKCIEKIKKQAHLKHVPVIIYSDYNSEDEIKEIYKNGATLFVSKPSSFSVLTEILKTLLSINWDKFNLQKADYAFLKEFESIKIMD